MKHPYMHDKTKGEIERYLAKPSHAILLVGAAKSGKTDIVRYISEQILGSQLKATDISTLDGESMGIQDVRNLLGELKLTLPGKDLSKRVIVISDIDKLGHEAQNALLKILEEPPKDTYFLATTSEMNSILPTVISRMTLAHVRPLALHEIKRQFSGKYPEKELIRAYHLSEGNIGLLKSILYSENDELSEAVIWAKQLLGYSTYEKLLVVDKMSKEEKSKIDLYLQAIQKVIRASLQYSRSQTKKDTEKRVKQLDSTLSAREMLQLNVSPKLILTNLFMKL